MYHYAYLLTFQDNMRYIGARSSTIKPELDTTYLGSGKALPKDRHDNRHLIKKEILKTFVTRQELMDYEKQFIIEQGCLESNEWYNQRVSTYDRHGTKTKDTSNYYYSSQSAKTFKRRYGNGYRTPAQISGAKEASKKLTGVKNPLKGHHGISNSGFVPWYYITPNGDYVEVHDKTKQEMASKLGFTVRQLTHRFHKTNQHKAGKSYPAKDWVFGNLPRPNLITDKD